MTTKADQNSNALLGVFQEIGIIDQLARSLFERCLPEAMTLSQFSVLNHLVRMGDKRTPLELARAFQVTKGAMTNTLQRLEGRALVRLEPDASDGRSKRVVLTRAGHGMRKRCVRSLQPLGQAMARELDLEKLAAIRPVLEELREYLDDNRDLDERVAPTKR